MGSGLLLLGEIIRPWGPHGEVKLRPYGDLKGALAAREGLFLEKDGEVLFLSLEEARFHRSFVLLKFKDRGDMESAEKLRGWKIGIPRETAPPLPPHTYYHYDIIGLEVVSEQGAEGRIVDIWNGEAQDIYVVEKDGREWLLPAAREIIQRIDLEKGEMLVKLPEGLTDLEEV
ncbi:MAG: ribosome maturation factor RimM [candidate division NC10 bacterium]|nr:ribosome maturation factor RimM [candidate division NC10 bacterium]